MYSMTGYGRASEVIDGRSLTIELKSVNHRFLDISIKLPHSLGFLEDTARKLIGARLSRGHVDVYLTYTNMRTDARTVQADTALAGAYKAAIEEVNASLGLQTDTGLSKVITYPDVLCVTESEEDEKALTDLLTLTMNRALDALLAMRAKEGECMKQALKKILDEIEQKSYSIDERYPQTVEEYARRLTARITELVGEQADPARIAQEAAIMADKAAVDEETVRLRTHIANAREKCDNTEPAGRSLDFLVQEMNREVNTISSKSLDIPITNAVLDCKSAIEKLREQLQNVE